MHTLLVGQSSIFALAPSFSITLLSRKIRLSATISIYLEQGTPYHLLQLNILHTSSSPPSCAASVASGGLSIAAVGPRSRLCPLLNPQNTTGNNFTISERASSQNFAPPSPPQIWTLLTDYRYLLAWFRLLPPSARSRSNHNDLSILHNWVTDSRQYPA